MEGRDKFSPYYVKDKNGDNVILTISPCDPWCDIKKPYLIISWNYSIEFCCTRYLCYSRKGFVVWNLLMYLFYIVFGGLLIFEKGKELFFLFVMMGIIISTSINLLFWIHGRKVANVYLETGHV